MLGTADGLIVSKCCIGECVVVYKTGPGKREYNIKYFSVSNVRKCMYQYRDNAKSQCV